MAESVTVIDGECYVCRKEGKGTYLTAARCLNCGWEGEIRHSLTHDKRDGGNETCPRCECRRVQPGDFVVEADGNERADG